MRFFVSTLLLLVSLFSSAQSQTGLNLSEYKVGAGDTIRILVFGEDDLTVESELSDAGTLSYPFLGELRLSGLNLSEIESVVDKGLRGTYLINPKVTVTIVEYREFYINGEVKKPGGFPFQPGLTVRKAVSLAGGFTERASKRNVFLISADDPSQSPSRVNLNSHVKPGDIITVEQSFF